MTCEHKEIKYCKECGYYVCMKCDGLTNTMSPLKFWTDKERTEISLKLTEEILKYFEETVLFDDGHYLDTFKEYSESDLGQKVTWEMMRQQILENQEIVDKIKSLVNDGWDLYSLKEIFASKEKR